MADSSEVSVAKQVSRRDFIRYAVVGGVAVVGGAAAGRYLLAGDMVKYGSRRRLAMTEAMVQMVDQSFVYHWVFEDLDKVPPVPSFPGPLIQAIEGDEVQLTITNSLPDVHGFRIPGVPGEVGDGVVIDPGQTREIDFEAPPGGSYMYFDHLNEPVNRVLGLHGPMIVLPKTGNTPYSNPSPAIQKLFDDLGTTEHFPGEPWKPERTRIWLFSTVDPRFNEMAQRGERIDPVRFTDEYLPRYFTINGESGAYASHNHNTVPHGRIGQPHVIRMMNAGMAAESPHIHGNHVYVLARDNVGTWDYVIWDNLRFIDTYTCESGSVMDWLLPFRRPPDIPGDEHIPLRDLIPTELSLVLGGVGQSPLAYPMHGHNEQSQSAAGGNYPQGLVTGWEITGDVDGIDFPHPNGEDKGGPPEGH
jgi:hypothetical protein